MPAFARLSEPLISDLKIQRLLIDVPQEAAMPADGDWCCCYSGAVNWQKHCVISMYKGLCAHVSVHLQRVLSWMCVWIYVQYVSNVRWYTGWTSLFPSLHVSQQSLFLSVCVCSTVLGTGWLALKFQWETHPTAGICLAMKRKRNLRGFIPTEIKSTFY